jgi:hypothetical protein
VRPFGFGDWVAEAAADGAFCGVIGFANFRRDPISVAT